MAIHNLGFISDENLHKHVQETVSRYRYKIDLASFSKNLVDPIKLSFDAAVYGKSIEEMIEGEVIRQINKSNTNLIGYFHQNIFQYFEGGWTVPEEGYDVVHPQRKIFTELKNKHNTMNSSSAQKTYLKMLASVEADDEAICMLVEVIAKSSRDKRWAVSIDGEARSHPRIRRISMDLFYKVVTGDPYAFVKLCKELPPLIQEAVQELGINRVKSSVLAELKEHSPDVLNSLYLMAFVEYEGFHEAYSEK